MMSIRAFRVIATLLFRAVCGCNGTVKTVGKREECDAYVLHQVMGLETRAFSMGWQIACGQCLTVLVLPTRLPSLEKP